MNKAKGFSVIFKKVVALILLLFLSCFILVSNVDRVSAIANPDYEIKKDTNISVEENFTDDTILVTLKKQFVSKG